MKMPLGSQEFLLFFFNQIIKQKHPEDIRNHCDTVSPSLAFIIFKTAD